MFGRGEVPSIRKKKTRKLIGRAFCQSNSKQTIFFFFFFPLTVESFGNKTKPPVDAGANTWIMSLSSNESQCATMFNSGIRIQEFGLIISQFDDPTSEFPASGPITYMGNDLKNSDVASGNFFVFSHLV